MTKAGLMTSIFLLLLCLGQCQPIFKKIVPGNEPEAKCLDGSPPAVFVHKGSNPNNILIYLTGNKSCEVAGASINKNIQNCIKQSKTIYGSSDLLPQTLNGSTLGFLGGDQKDNRFSSWTKIIIPGCGGSAFIGNNRKVIEKDGQKIYFRESVNMRSILQWIDNKYDLNNSQKVVFAGGSLGGAGVLVWIDYLKSITAQPDKVYGVVDSGLFYDFDHVEFFYNNINQIVYLIGVGDYPSARLLQGTGGGGGGTGGGAIAVNSSMPVDAWQKVPSSINEGLQNFHSEVMNADDTYPNGRCVQQLGEQNKAKCIFPMYSYPYVQSKLLWLQPQYDTFFFKTALSLQCIKIDNETSISSPQDCLPAHQVLMDIQRSNNMHKGLFPLAKAGHSVWSNACGWHEALSRNAIYDSDKYRASDSGGKLTAKQALEKFVFEGETIVEIDPYPWPSNAGCAFMN